MINKEPLVFSRITVGYYKPSIKSILISITSMDGVFAEVDDSLFEKVLRLRFDDIDKITRDFTVISSDQALQVVNLTKWANEQSEDFQIVVNCDAGRSRSPGVAAAIAKFFLDDDTMYFVKYTPNMFVYRKILKALEKSS